LRRQRRYDEALGVLDRAQQQLQDRAELRLGRVAIWADKGGPQAVAVLNGPAEGLGALSREQRHVLRAALAAQPSRAAGPAGGAPRDLAGAGRLWRQVAEQEPSDLESRVQLLELDLQAGSRPDIDKDLKEIERIDGMQARYYQAWYLIWQAGRAADPDARQR